MEEKEIPNVFEDDLVCIGDNKERVGEVVKVGWIKSNDDDHIHGEHCHHDEEDEEESELEENQVLVAWITGELTKEDYKNLTVLERYISMGDNVHKIPKDKNEPLVMGIVTSIQMYLDIETKKGLLKNVHVENLKHTHNFQRDEFVISKKGKWIGRIFNSVSDVTILFEDGAACIIPEADSSVLKVITANNNNNAPEEGGGEPSMVYNPGDVVRANKAILKEAQWINGKNNNKRGMATVIEVKPTMIFVDWFSNGDWAEPEEFPPGDCSPKEITVIDPFDKFNWGIGDVCYLRKGLQDSKELDQVSKAEFEGTPMGTLKSKNNNKGAAIKNFISNSTGKVVSLYTYINVEWQDGTVSEKVSSTTVCPVYETSEKDFFPNEYVYEQDGENFGVVKTVNVKDLTCDVKWAPNSTIPKERLDENGVEKGISIFSLREHPFNEFRLASCVIKLPKGEKNPKNWCGFIVKAEEFKFHVKWNSGELTVEDPKDLMVLNTNEDDDDDLMGDDFEGAENEDDSQEGPNPNTSDFVFSFGDSKVVKPTKPESYNQVLDETNNLVVILFGETWNMQSAQMMNSIDTLSMQHQDVTFIYVNIEDFKPEEANDTKSIPAFKILHKRKVLSGWEGSDENQLKGEIERWNQTIKSSTTSTTNNNTSSQTSTSTETSTSTTTVGSSSSVDGFVMLHGAPTKHCFLVQQPEVVNSKIVLKELEDIATKLPKGTFLRFYEARLDIFRVLILGAENTPFAYTPFIFDVQIPSLYPKVPPNVFFNSFVKEKMHPNLFVNGKVCDSLIGTFEGDHVWDPNTGNIANLVQHFQSDVLSDSQPYFSEPDYEELKGTRKGEYSSRVFSENSLLLSLRNIIYVLKNNPFEEFKTVLVDFYKSKKTVILDNLKKFLAQDVKVDQPLYSVPFEGTSRGFQVVLKSLYEELTKLFENL